MFIIFLHNDFDMHVSSGLFSPSDRKQNVCFMQPPFYLPKSTQMMDTEQVCVTLVFKPPSAWLITQDDCSAFIHRERFRFNATLFYILPKLSQEDVNVSYFRSYHTSLQDLKIGC